MNKTFRNVLLGFLLFPITVMATPVTYDMNYSLGSGQGTATGYATFDDSLLAPSQGFGSIDDKTGLLDFNLVVTNLAASPTSTCFTFDDITGWIFTTDSGGTITDLNVFMLEFGPQDVLVTTNSDGFSAIGINVFALAISQGEGTQSDVQSTNTLAVFNASPTPRSAPVSPCLSAPAVARAIPTLSYPGLITAVLLLLATGGLMIRLRA